LTVGVTGIVKDSSGNVGIGNASPSGYKLAVGDGSSNRGRIMLKGATSGNYPEINIDDSMNTSGKNYQLYSTGGVLKVANQTDSGAVSFVSNAFGIGLGDNAAVDGTGIRFPATQSASTNANTLDDYEEGTYTPVFSASGLTYTQGTTLAKYVKVGRLVTFTASVQWSGKSGGTGDLKISLPFAASSDSGAWQGLFVFGYSSGINVVIKTGYCDPGGIVFNPVRADSSTSIIQAGDMAAAGHVIFGGTYQT
jgi:hypothetical protein